MPGLRRRPPPMSPDDDEMRIYDPFGKGGAGAPVRDQRGNVVTTVFGNFNVSLAAASAAAGLAPLPVWRRCIYCRFIGPVS